MSDQHLPPSIEDLMAAKADGKLSLCAVCRVPIQILTEYDGTITFLHGQSYRHHDHEPVPLIVENTQDYASDCDFCSTRTELHWTFDGNHVTFTSPMGLTADGRPLQQENDLGNRWSACAACGPMVNAKDVEGLLRRVTTVSSMFKRTPKFAQLELIQQWRQMWGDYFASIHTTDYHGPTNPVTRLTPRLMPKIQEGLLRFWADERWSDSQLKATDRRHPFVFPGVHAGQEDLFEVRYPPSATFDRSVWTNHTQHLRAGIGVADLYWISRDFTQLSIMAGKEFEKIEISREELPSPFGLMVFEDPIGEVQSETQQKHIVAVSWSLVPQGVWLNLYLQPEQGSRPDFDVTTMRADIGYLVCPNPGIGLKFDNEYNMPHPEEPDFALTILAAWFLINQPGVAELTLAPVDKKLARSAARAGRKLPPVQIVDLRKRPRRTGGEHVGHPLKVRVYRKGHWKRQFYGPKRGMRKTIYVSGYIAGPEGAPLKARTPTVKVLR